MKTNLSYEFLAYTGQCRILSRSPLKTMKLRLEIIKTWRGLADSLAEANRQIFSNMDSGCALVLKGKQSALLEKLATDFDWPDKSIHQEIKTIGCRYTGLQCGSVRSGGTLTILRVWCQCDLLLSGKSGFESIG